MTALAGRRWILTAARRLLVGALLPFVAYQLLSALGMPELYALLCTSIFPLAQVAIEWIRARSPDAIGLFVCGSIALDVALTFLTGLPRFLLLHHSLGTAALGIALLASLALRRPLVFHLGRQLLGGTAERERDWDRRWEHPGFRRGLRVLNGVAGAVFLVISGSHAVLVFTAPVPVVLLLGPVMGVGMFGLLVAWAVPYGRSRWAAADRMTRNVAPSPGRVRSSTRPP